MQQTNGSSRILILAALVLSGMVLSVGMVVLFSPDGEHDPTESAETVDTPTVPRPGARRGASTDSADDEDDVSDEGIETAFLDDSGLREPSGDVMPMSVDRLGKSIDLWLTEPGRSEEMRRCIYELQREGSVIPPELLERILAKLEEPEYRVDAMLALEMVKDDATGVRLVEIATDPSKSEDVRQAVLLALSKSGVKSASSAVIDLLRAEDLPLKVRRAAVLALGGIGGADPSRTLAGLLAAHHEDDDLRSVLLTAATMADDVGSALAELSRTARASGDVQLSLAVMTIAIQKGENVDPTFRQEVLSVVQSGVGSTDLDPEDAQRIRGSAITAASTMGEIDAVLSIVANDTDHLRGVALNALRNARGDEAAKKIGAFLDGQRDGAIRRDLVMALGETRSKEATAQLIEALSSEDANIRQAAAIGLGSVRAAKAVPAILARLEVADEPYGIRKLLVDALGKIGSRDALEKLQAWLDDERPEWKQLRPFVSNAINRIKSGNPDSQMLEPSTQQDR